MMFVLLFVNAGFTSLHTSRSLSSGKGSTWYPKVLYSYTPHKLLGLLKYKDTFIIYNSPTGALYALVRYFPIKFERLTNQSSWSNSVVGKLCVMLTFTVVLLEDLMNGN